MKCPDDYNVVMIPLPGDVLACVRVDYNGYPTVYINDYLSLEAKRQALRHELAHFHNGDFDNRVTIYDAEKRAAAASYTNPMPRAFRPLTQEEYVQLMLIGVSLFADATEPYPCNEPLEMPDPMFDRQPDRYVNVQRRVW